MEVHFAVRSNKTGSAFSSNERNISVTLGVWVIKFREENNRAYGFS